MSRGTATRSVTASSAPEVLALFRLIPAAGMFDLIVELIRSDLDGLDLDGPPLVAAIELAYAPVRRRRGERPIRPRAVGADRAADRERIVELVELLTTRELERWGQLVYAGQLYQELRELGWTDGQGRRDLRELVKLGRLERVIDRDDVLYRLERDECARRSAARGDS